MFWCNLYVLLGEPLRKVCFREKLDNLRFKLSDLLLYFVRKHLNEILLFIKLPIKHIFLNFGFFLLKRF